MSGSPPIELTKVPPLLLAEGDSVPTHAHTSSTYKTRIRFTGAMSSPRRENVECGSSCHRESHLQPTRLRPHPRVIEPHRTLRQLPQLRRESVPTMREALPAARSTHVQFLHRPRTTGARTDHLRRGSSRAATARLRLATVRCRRVFFREL